MNDQFRIFPERASTVAQRVDMLYFFLLAVATFFTVLIFCSIVYFAIKYRRGKKIDRTVKKDKVWLLELAWSLIPLGLTMIMFAWGARLFFTLHQPPDNCLEVDVVGKQWMWRIQHAEGKREINTLHVPVGQPVRLRMISEDVIHSLYIPAFRIKQDLLPGRYTEVWFEATKTGQYDLYCAEYCGTSHSRMRGRVVVMEPTQYAEWLEGSTDETPEVAGKRLFEELRCQTCHVAEGGGRCPSLVDLYASQVPLTGEAAVVADDDYLRESILEPNAKVVAGYQKLMPTYQGQISEEEILQLIAYLKTLRTPDQTKQDDEAAGDAPTRSAEVSMQQTTHRQP